MRRMNSVAAEPTSPPSPETLDRSIASAADALIALQRPDGHWVFELEADATIPVEIMLLPKWFPFHLDKISYWSRTVIVPLLVLMARKPKARNALGVTIDELFEEPTAAMRPAPRAPQQKHAWFAFFAAVDALLR